ncbi:sensor domain-containing protein [Actinoplanes couchii]|uniref:GGDEF domain-containing protein n=1 Tax=Actinoplanes couchii TaxID=403638 RepID=A0ABQ3XQN2_9ACTN|nr:GGDEF domain-containing phosphodiesterase [Actinoplanes couchii]MDR6318790.1 diguanylate cyclase (GGDEF)-like protein/PAS domain S-box-containing protein [Actinoplanes couchii]GID60821.1 GGDEF domain-containing protein [Actinoplanes couchii]
MIDDEARVRAWQAVPDESLRMALDHASSGMTLVDDSGRYLWVNAAFAGFLGYTVAELLGRYFGDFTLEQDHAADVAAVGDLMSGARRAVLREKQYRHRDGAILPALVSSSLIQPVPEGPWQLLSTIESLAERQAARERLAEVASAVDGIVTVDERGIVVAWNHGAERLFGRIAADMLGSPLAVVIPARRQVEHGTIFAELVAGGSPLIGTTIEVTAVHADGHELLTELSLSTWTHDGLPRFTAIVRDVTVHRRAERAAALIRFAAVTANSADTFAAAASAVLREVCARLQWHAGHAWTGAGEPVGWHESGEAHPVPSVVPFEAVTRIVTDGGGAGSAVSVPMLTGGEVAGMLVFRLPAGVPAPDHDVLQALEQIGLALGRVVERQRTSDALAWQATHDPVTDLANRRLLTERIRDGRHRALLLINLDRFRIINDALGYALGDQILRLAGERLLSVTGEDDLVARLSADEFVVLAQDQTDLAQRLLAVLREPMTIGGHEFRLGASIGIRPLTGSHRPAAVLRDADAALRQAKSRGKDQVVVFDDALAGTAEQRFDDELALARAITGDELVLHYQPIIDLQSGQPSGAEALVRWHRPGHGMIAPDRFIPLAEETGLIVDLGRWVLRQACRDAAVWAVEAPALAEASVSVNVSARQLTHPNFIGDLDAALADSTLPAGRLILEVTESALISEPETAMDTLRAVRARGVQVALDDFGTGYSSLSYVQRLPATILKIDKSFVDPITEDAVGTALTEVVVKLAEATGLRTVAEGVENAVQAAALRRLGCHRGQGFVWSRPVPQSDLHHVLTQLSGDPALVRPPGR